MTPGYETGAWSHDRPSGLTWSPAGPTLAQELGDLGEMVDLFRDDDASLGRSSLDRGATPTTATDCLRASVRMWPMVEVSPHLSLAFALHSSPGTYALLLGAGVSLPLMALTEIGSGTHSVMRRRSVTGSVMMRGM